MYFQSVINVARGSPQIYVIDHLSQPALVLVSLFITIGHIHLQTKVLNHRETAYIDTSISQFISTSPVKSSMFYSEGFSGFSNL